MNINMTDELMDEKIQFLRDYQRSAIESIKSSFLSGDKKVLLELAVGTGKTYIMVNIAKIFLEQKIINKILYLTSNRASVDQVIAEINSIVQVDNIKEFDNQEIVVTTYSEFLAHITSSEMDKFDLVLCDDAKYMQSEKYSTIFKGSKAFFIGIDSNENMINRQAKANWFSNAKIIYKFSTSDAINAGYVNPSIKHGFAEEFVKEMFMYLSYQDIKLDASFKIGNSNSIRPDIVINENDRILAIEVKTYKSRYNTRNIIDNAIYQILYYKTILENLYGTEKVKLFLILLCEVDTNMKEQFFKQYNIAIWDISNILYICKSNQILLDKLVSNLTYSINDISPIKPCGFELLRTHSIDDKKLTNPVYSYEELIQKLLSCPTGKERGSAVKYEQICTDIICYLFKSEFTKTSSQHKTGDDIFRMDLLCSLKGTTSFWKFLNSYYNTKFIVFEYKNYNKPISQNLIYITEKYLFNKALRNVAMIVSRKGFDDNSKKAALGCLREHGKLIIELKDEDLIYMLRLKGDGEEPSDFLMSKVEDLLMSVSK